LKERWMIQLRKKILPKEMTTMSQPVCVTMKGIHSQRNKGGREGGDVLLLRSVAPCISSITIPFILS
jgi:hypothetical protein